MHILGFELSYGLIDDLCLPYKLGDHIRVRFVEMSSEKIKVLRRLLKESLFSECLSCYVPSGEYAGVVSGV